MARHKKHPEHENLERWLVSYADFMTLLFATFTALYALGQADVSKLKGIGEAIREGFEQQSIMSGIKSILQGKSAPNHNPDPISSEKGAGAGVIGKYDSMMYQPGDVHAMEQVAQSLAKEAQAMNKELQADADLHKPTPKIGLADLGQGATGEGGAADRSVPLHPIDVSVQERGIRISFDSRLLFEPANATLKSSGWKFLDGVAEHLKKLDYHRIHVEGHTDNQPITSALYPSNWELSAARASSVVRYLIQHHDFTPSALVAVGYGDTQPLGNNNTAEGRSQNRRVDLILYTNQVSGLLNPRLQYLKEQSLTQSPLNTDPSIAAKSISKTPVATASGANIPKTPVAAPPEEQEGPVKVIIQDKDGTERILIPKK